MGFIALHVLCLLPAFTFTRQEIVKLSASPSITAECGKQVILQCNVSSMSPNELAIKHMGWLQNGKTLCTLNSDGNIAHRRDSLSDFHCEYESQQLSLIFKKLQHLESGDSKPYMCKLQSNQGAAHVYSRVDIQECCGNVEGVLSSKGPVCTFNHVYPDGYVHWFHGSHYLSDESLQVVTKHMDNEGWMTIRSFLKRESSDVPYNCSLMGTISGRYIASTLVHNSEVLAKGSRIFTHSNSNSIKSQGPLSIILSISVLLSITLK
ncbi:uncharacterized protein LOC113127732 [Mastacembelus armatus]|uniref:uncharacterized protein LOC113127732 n=1 Tax=Mastacembelus armatus TaxID=205130 RepID=UPI000E458716|nr:uncharacterized protein LOC113127732 [Mastacembelus armatus]XP_026158252.1 uncharacterized protein LOC113127732 [Mastacembelus armatus]